MLYHFVFDELAELLASMDPDKVLSFKTSHKSQLRLEDLLEKNRSSEGLSVSEKEEMEQFMLVEHIVGQAKARALKLLASKQSA